MFFPSIFFVEIAKEDAREKKEESDGGPLGPRALAVPLLAPLRLRKQQRVAAATARIARQGKPSAAACA